MLRRAGLIATLLAGLTLLGTSLHGMTRVDRTLRVAAAKPQPEHVLEHHRTCARRGPRV